MIRVEPVGYLQAWPSIGTRDYWEQIKLAIRAAWTCVISVSSILIIDQLKGVFFTLKTWPAWCRYPVYMDTFYGPYNVRIKGVWLYYSQTSHALWKISSLQLQLYLIRRISFKSKDKCYKLWSDKYASLMNWHIFVTFIFLNTQ